MKIARTIIHTYKISDSLSVINIKQKYKQSEYKKTLSAHGVFWLLGAPNTFFVSLFARTYPDGEVAIGTVLPGIENFRPGLGPR